MSEDQLLHIQLLSERNRLKKLLNTTNNNREKELNFNTHINGANNERIKLQKIREKQIKPDERIIKKQWSQTKLDENFISNNKSQNNSNNTSPKISSIDTNIQPKLMPRNRAKWMIQSIEIKSDTGLIHARPSGLQSSESVKKLSMKDNIIPETYEFSDDENYNEDNNNEVQDNDIEYDPNEDSISLSIRKSDIQALRSSINIENNEDFKANEFNNPETILEDIKENDSSNNEINVHDECAEMLLELNQPQLEPRESDSIALHNIIKKISSMNASKRKVVLNLLNKLDDGEVDEIDSTIWDAYGALSPKKSSNKNIKINNNSKNTKKAEVAVKNNIITNLPEVPFHYEPNESVLHVPNDKDKKSSFLLEVDANEFSKDPFVGISTKGTTSWQIVIRAFSNWGRLTEIEVFDVTGQKIRLAPSCLTLEGRLIDDPSHLVQITRVQLGRLIKGITKTTNENQMWLTSFPLVSDCLLACLDLTISYSSTTKANPPASIKLWNYNKSIEDRIKGEVWLDNDCVFHGDLNQGSGNTTTDYSQTISLDKSTSMLEKSPVNELPVSNFMISEESFDKSVSFHAQNNESLDATYIAPKIEELPPRPSTALWLPEKVNDASLLSKSIAIVPLNYKGGDIRSSINFGKSLLDNLCNSEIEKKPPITGRRSQVFKVPLVLGADKVASELEIKTSTSKIESKTDGLTDLTYISKSRATSPALDNLNLKIAQSRGSPLDFKKPEIKKEEKLTALSVLQKLPEPDDDPVYDLTASIDSLSYFERNHAGRLSSINEKAVKIVSEPISDFFSIPEFPTGKQLVLNITSTWGDQHYVGLSGVEIFDQFGQLIKISKKQISAHPSSINILPGYGKDPRIISNLVDGINATSDDLHVWLAPFTPGQSHLISIEFVRPFTISMIRIWNYNKNRVHSARGAKHMDMYLDNTIIFRGEIAQAPGDANQFAEVICFTSDQILLERLAYEVDRIDSEQLFRLEKELNESDDFDESVFELVDDGFDDTINLSRPTTSDGLTVSTDQFHLESNHPLFKESSDPISIGHQRPLTAANIKTLHSKFNVLPTLTENEDEITVKNNSYLCSSLVIAFRETHGDESYSGLTSLLILDENYHTIQLDLNMINAHPRDLNEIPGHSGDIRTLDKLIDQVNITTDDSHMWLSQFLPPGINNRGGFKVKTQQWISVEFDAPRLISGIVVYNYNKSLDDTYRGVKSVDIFIDNKLVSPPNGFYLRKAPGNTHFDFGQTIIFKKKENETNENIKLELDYDKRLYEWKRQKFQNNPSYSIPNLPSGHVLRFVFHSTWGDASYLGLNGLEIYDASGSRLNLNLNNFAAIPESVAVLPNMSNDTRKLENILLGSDHNFNDVSKMWLTLFTQNQPVILYIYFDFHFAISLIKFWNYFRTPNRGVRDIQVYMDDTLIWQGVLRKAPTEASLSFSKNDNFAQSVVFTSDQDIIAREMAYINEDIFSDQEIHFYDQKNGNNDTPLNNLKPDLNLTRPMTSCLSKK